MEILQDILENITNSYANPAVGGGKNYFFIDPLRLHKIDYTLSFGSAHGFYPEHI